MTSKYHSTTADSTGLSSLSCFSPQFSLNASLLASIIPLPDNPFIAYSVWSPAPSTSANLSDSLTLVEQARKRIIQHNTALSILDSLLLSLYISGNSVALYVFAIGSQDKPSDSQAALAALKHDGLTVSESSSFTPAGLYPCSDTCSTQSIPCPVCLAPIDPLQSSSSARLLPRRSLRRPFVQFLNGIRDHLIHAITQSPHNVHTVLSGTPAVRLKNGFLFGATPSQSEWRSGWDRYPREHPLTYCELSIHLSQISRTSARLVVQPWLRLSYYHPLSSLLPAPAGTPLILLPHGVPAYFLSLYTGPSSTLTAHFDDALLGFGAGGWKGKSMYRASASLVDANPVYVIVWVSVQNGSGEEKGMLVVWPASLCIAFVPGAPSAHAQSVLTNIPALPAILQASPPPPDAHIPLSIISMSGSTPVDQNMASKSSQDSLPAPTSPHSPPASPCQDPVISLTRCPGLIRSPSYHALQAFKSLTIQQASQGIDAVSFEVSGFVGAIAREREKERERIKRERQAGGAQSTVGQETPMASAASLQQESEMADDSLPPPPESKDTPFNTGVPNSDTNIDDYPGSLFSDDGSNLDMPGIEEAASSVPVVPRTDVGAVSDVQPHSTSLAPPVSLPSSLDSFPGFDPGWPQPNGDFLPMNTDYGIDFINLDTLAAVGDGTLGSTDDLDMEGGFGVFTEDDFNFFDAPTVAGVDNVMGSAQAIPAHSLASDITPSVPAGLPLAAFARSPFDDGLQSSGPGPPSVANSQPSPWTTFHGGESCTPQPDGVDLDSGLSLPVKTRWPFNERHPPTVQLSEQHGAAPISPPAMRMSRYHSAFDPILFNTTHRKADDKYALGKFALPSPPDEEESSDLIADHIPTLPSPSAAWKSRYTIATDPRIGMMRKLAGAKRRLFGQGGRVPNVSPGRFRDGEEWTAGIQPLEDNNSESEEEETWITEDRPSPIPKSATPPPSYLPLGPTLLQTHFHYPFLLPLSIALHTPESGLQPENTSHAIMSVPTPVSPAAILGASSEKTKSLEAAGQILLREAVENPVWADAWQANAEAKTSGKTPRDIWPVDIKRVAKLLNGLESLRCPVDLEALLRPGLTSHSDTGGIVQSLESPLLSVGKDGEIIHVLPPALRFWEKLGLLPRAGVKDVMAFICFEQVNEQREHDIGNLLGRLSSLYTAKHYGQHLAGQAAGCTRDGIVPIQLDTIRKTLSTFVAGLPSMRSNIVIYILTPDCILQLASPILRQVLSAIKRVNKTRQANSPILFQFLPECLLAATASAEEPIETFVDSVYDRILCAVDRKVLPRYPSSGEDTRIYQQDPAFTLARSTQTKVKFVREEYAEVLGIVDRYTMLHVGYQVTHHGKWLLATCVDQRGEAHDLKAWLMPDDDTIDTFIVNSVWSFALALAAQASVEWHLVVAKRGAIAAHELDAWVSHFDTVLHGNTSSPMQVSLLSVEQNNPWYFFPNGDGEAWSTTTGRAAKATGSVALDVSSTTFALHSSVPTPVLRRPCGVTGDRPVVGDSAENPSDDELGVLPITTSTLIHVPSGMDHTCISMLHLHFLYISRSLRSSSSMTDNETRQEVTKNFHELKELAKARWPMVSRNLPIHLAALEVMSTTLDGPSGDACID